MDKLSKALAFFQANKRARLQRIEHERQMAQIDANSPELQYQQKMRWLSATGQADEMKKMIHARGILDTKRMIEDFETKMRD